MTRRASKVTKLPPEIRELIGELCRNGRSLDDIIAKLREMNLPPDDLPSRSGLGRYLQQCTSITEELHRQRVVAEMLVNRFGDEADSKTARLNIALMQGLLNKLMFTEDGEIATLSAEEALMLSKSIQALTSASKADAQRVIQVRQQTLKDAAKAAESVANARGMSADLVKAITAEILGVRA